jgi:transcriptional antiterminator NusG
MSTENVSSEDQPEVSESLEAGLDGPLSAEVVSGQGGQVDAGAPAGDVADADLNEFGFSADEMVTEDDLEEEELVAEASPIEELVEETVVGEVDESEMDWYILKVQVNREKSICDNLRRNVKRAGMEAYFQDILVPTEDVREFTKAGKQRVVKRKLYPGYIVVRMAISDESWFLVRETSGIGDFTGSGGKPAPLSAEEIDRIISTSRPVEDEESEEKIKTAIPFKEGDRVRVKEGYFQNYEGDVSAVDERNGRITVMIDIFGRPNPVELDHWHVESVA